MFKKLFLFLCILCALWMGGLYLFIRIIPNKSDIVSSARITDSIVVLTGGSERVTKGFDLLLAGKGNTLFISGVGEDTTLADIIEKNHIVAKQKNALLKMEKSIFLGKRAPDTRSNAQETRDWIGEHHIKSIRLVTANYHMPRALLEFEKRIPDVDIIPEPVLPNDFYLQKWWNHAGSARLILSEYMKYIAIYLGR